MVELEEKSGGATFKTMPIQCQSDENPLDGKFTK
jgi:hypothetical protein